MRQTILLVEDEASAAEVIEDVLTDAGYTVLVARDAPGALAIGAAHPIDLLLTDVDMPGGDGVDLAARVRLIRPAVKVLLMSGWTVETVPGGVGNLPFMPKPFTFADLVERIQALLQGRA